MTAAAPRMAGSEIMPLAGSSRGNPVTRAGGIVEAAGPREPKRTVRCEPDGGGAAPRRAAYPTAPLISSWISRFSSRA